MSLYPKYNKYLPAILGLVAFPSLSQAHPGHIHLDAGTEYDALTSGFSHPFTGVDHLILALAAGWLACALGKGKALIPVGVFLATLAVGALAARGASTGVGLEIALTLTLIAAGILFFAEEKLKNELLCGVLAVAGFIHGFAHGAEALPNLSFGLSLAGFFTGTAVIIGFGGLLYSGSKRHSATLTVSRLAGVALLAVGALSLGQVG